MKRLLRIVDANLNRSQEGLRVCEDIMRFMLNDRGLSRSFKTARLAIGSLAKKIYKNGTLGLVKFRDVRKDVGKATRRAEAGRKDVYDVFLANSQRAKESLRVLEEITKLLDTEKKEIPEGFKILRFKVYELEKKSRNKVEALLHN